MRKSGTKSVLAICLGQLLSLCITGTSSVSSALWKHYTINIPFTQNFCNYLLLAITYRLICRHRHSTRNRSLRTSRARWRFFGFSVADVQANVLVVHAFKNTSLLSVLVLSSWTTPCIMLLSTYFLHAHYSRSHIGSAVLCMIGLTILVYSDTMKNSDPTAGHSWVGDLAALCSATLYAISNVTEEHLVQHYSTTEFLGQAGFWGSILCGLQALYFEYDQIIHIQWTWSIVLLVATYVLCLFCMYSLVPTLYRMAGATFVSLSLISSNFYSLIVGLLLLEAEMPTLYPIAYSLVIIGVTIYTLTPPSSSPSNTDIADRKSIDDVDNDDNIADEEAVSILDTEHLDTTSASLNHRAYQSITVSPT